jgi:hypothetical protein
MAQSYYEINFQEFKSTVCDQLIGEISFSSFRNYIWMWFSMAEASELHYTMGDTSARTSDLSASIGQICSVRLGCPPPMMTAQISPPRDARYLFSRVHTGAHQFHAFTRVTTSFTGSHGPNQFHTFRFPICNIGIMKKTWNMNIEILQHRDLTCATTIMNVYSSLTNRILHATWMKHWCNIPK